MQRIVHTSKYAVAVLVLINKQCICNLS